MIRRSAPGTAWRLREPWVSLRVGGSRLLRRCAPRNDNLWWLSLRGKRSNLALIDRPEAPIDPAATSSAGRIVMALAITPLHPDIGAEIGGLDIGRPID